MGSKIVYMLASVTKPLDLCVVVEQQMPPQLATKPSNWVRKKAHVRPEELNG
jgi:hypothetical protein